jgi:hypothetical protein
VRARNKEVETVLRPPWESTWAWTEATSAWIFSSVFSSHKVLENQDIFSCICTIAAPRDGTIPAHPWPMRFPFLALALSITGAIACASTEDSEVSASDLTDVELARKALESVGTSVDGVENHNGVCTQCHNHDVNNVGTFKRWASNYKSAMAILKDTSKPKDQRINLLRADPTDPTSKFDIQKLGIITAGANLGLGPSVRADRHPNTTIQNRLIADLFAGKPLEYEQFLVDTLMPREARFDRFSAGQYEAILTWMERGLPELNKFIKDEGRASTCVEDLSKLKDHPSKVRARSWATINTEAKVPMVACKTHGDASTCFVQQFAGKDVFPEVQKHGIGKAWPMLTGSVRVAQEMAGKQGYFWSRVSADGRFFALGGGSKTSVIVDIAAALDPAGPKTRVIKVQADYDPDFFPGNRQFMFQSTAAGGGRVCAQSLLAKPEVTTITFSEPECSALDGIGLYQTVAQAKGDNEFSDLFIVNNASNGADNPASTDHHDRSTNAGPGSSVMFSVALSQGTESGFKMSQHETIPLPFHGDTMASRSLELLGSRIEGVSGALGYAITRVTKAQTATGYSFTANDIGRICMPGNKANFSFDERFLVTHHYLERSDFESDAAWAPYKAEGGSEVLLVDFVTGKKTTVLRTAPGQHASFPHFRSDGWMFMELRDRATRNGYVLVSDAAVRAVREVPTP